MTTDTEALTYDDIVALALEHGFKLKPQVDGRMALNDYVIDFARAVYDIGRAAAKSEPADVGEPAAWMAVVTHSRSQGPQAHFVSDAKLARQWDYNGVVDGEPCIVQPLFTAHQLAAAVAAERERCIDIIESYRIPVGNSAAGELACEWTYDAIETIRDAIRAGAPPDTPREAGAVAGGAA